jgi:hypothetical protein
MSLTAILIIGVFIITLLVYRIFHARKVSKEYQKVIYEMQSQWDGWIELSDPSLHPLMFGKVLYSINGNVVGVGVLVKEHLPAMLVSDIDTKIGPQLLDNRWPLCRFLIDRGRDVIITELKDMELREKLKPYVANYSKIKLMIGLNSQESVLVDNEEGKKDFERIWEEAREAAERVSSQGLSQKNSQLSAHLKI